MNDMAFDNSPEKVGAVFRQALVGINTESFLKVEKIGEQLSLVYFADKGSRGYSDTTSVKCQINLEREDMWIGNLKGDPSLRFRGWGTHLVKAMENVGNRMSITVIKVLLLHSARGFWQRMGYGEHKITARVMVKELRVY